MALLSEKIRKLARFQVEDVTCEDTYTIGLANEALALETALADATKRAEEADDDLANAREDKRYLSVALSMAAPETEYDYTYWLGKAMIYAKAHPPEYPTDAKAEANRADKGETDGE